MPIADRMHRMGTEAAFRVLARAKVLEGEGHDVIHLEMGEPDFTTPEIEHIVRHKKFQLQLSLPGYEPYKTKFDFKKRRTVTIDRRLKKSG